MDWDRIRIFHAVAQVGSFTRAASRLGLSQSAISRHRQLMQELGLDRVYLERLRLSDGEPLAIDRVWIPAQLAAPLLEADFTHTSVYAQLDRCCGIRLTGGREQVRAVVPTPAEQRLLGLEPGTAALYVERVGELRGRPVEWRQTLFRGDRFAFATDLADPDRMTVTGGGPLRP